MRRGSRALLLTLLACAHRGPPPEPRAEALTVGGSRFVVQGRPGEDLARVRAALERAAPRVSRWGALSAPVVITIHPDHADLEAAVHREGYPWLRAWARYASVEIQAPGTWARGSAGDAELEELVAHELTHCLLYQRGGDALGWPAVDDDVPLWFREGMASVTAGQEHRRLDRDALRSRLRAAGSGGGAGGAGPDPLTDPEPLQREAAPVVYATAHWAFRFLLDRYGEARVGRILDGLSRGLLFRRAFREAIGIPAPAFEAEFRRYLAWRGWR